MPCDNELVERVGRDNSIEICKQMGCNLWATCFPRNGRMDLCKEWYDQVEKQYPECVMDE